MSKTILLADDSLTIQKVVELTFLEEDYEVVAVSTGDEAVAKLSEVTPALVITDIHMPGASGFEVCRRAKESHPGVPVLLLVGTFEEFDEAEAAACGAEGHLKKPFDSQELLRLAESLVAGASGEGVQAAAAAEESQPVTTVPEPDTTLLMDDEEKPPRAFEDAGPAVEAEVVETGEFVETGEVAEPGQVFEPGRVVGPGQVVEPGEPVGRSAEPAVAEPVSTGEFEAAGEQVPEVEAVPEPQPEPAEPAAAAPAAEPAPAEGTAASGGVPGLSDEDVERIARRVVELLSDKTVREVSWDVIPDLAEVVIKDRLRELESQVD